MKNDTFVIGVDFGTDSVRSVLVDTSNGNEISQAVFVYPRWRDQLYCDASINQFRQHPLDYLEGLEFSVKECLRLAGGPAGSKVRGISVDTTGSTPVAVNQSGLPLALVPGLENNPNAMFVLWKDHSSVKEAAEINEHAKKFEINYLRYVGGIYSSEWFWAKLLHILRNDETLRTQCCSWVEHCDWIPFVLCGGTHLSDLKRGVCSAGHKALWAEEFGGLPPEKFFSSLDPLLAGFRDRLFAKTYSADKAAGLLSPEWAMKWGLPANTVVGIGAFDAHMGAVGGQIEPYHLSKVMGTSTCDMLVAPLEDVKTKLIKGICGQVPGSVIPGMMGMEAGQSAFGDAYAWFRNVLSWPLRELLSGGQLMANSQQISAIIDQIIPALADRASAIPLDSKAELAIDWFNGRRTPDSSQLVKGAITGVNLGSDAPALFRSIAEATCFGAKAIVDRFNEEGVPVKGLIGLGGVARKSAFIMQMMADIMNMPIRIHRSEQTCAIGAAMFAATAAGIYSRVEEAMEKMGQGFDISYQPNAKVAIVYQKRYERYKKLGTFLENENF